MLMIVVIIIVVVVVAKKSHHLSLSYAKLLHLMIAHSVAHRGLLEVFSLFVLFRLHHLCRGLEEGTNTCAPKMDDLSTPFEPETAPG